MKWIVACEESGTVRDALLAAGHDAVSCDILPTRSPGPHIQKDVRLIDLTVYDGMIAHPPCTDLAVSGAHAFKAKRADGRQHRALKFVQFLLDAPIPRIALENPVSIISSQIRKPDQYVQPWEFGDDASKKTGWWLSGLPLLQPTDVIDPPFYGCSCGHRFEYDLGPTGCPNCHGEGGDGELMARVKPIYSNQTPSGQNKLGPSPTRARDRAHFYPGMARAIAEQWGSYQT